MYLHAATSGIIKLGLVGKNKTKAVIIRSNPRETIPAANCIAALAPACRFKIFAFIIDYAIR